MTTQEALHALSAAIAAYTGDTGPVSWSAEQGHMLKLCAPDFTTDRPSYLYAPSVLLVGIYPASETTDPLDDESYLTDEPWKQYGGDAILAAAGLTQADSGMDGYTDKWGDDMVSQWVACPCDAEDD